MYLDVLSKSMNLATKSAHLAVKGEKIGWWRGFLDVLLLWCLFWFCRGALAFDSMVCDSGRIGSWFECCYFGDA